jgi:hypothetical protein
MQPGRNRAIVENAGMPVEINKAGADPAASRSFTGLA